MYSCVLTVTATIQQHHLTPIKNMKQKNKEVFDLINHSKPFIHTVHADLSSD